MIKYLLILMFGASVWASGTRFVDVDILRSADHTKLWTPPATSGTLGFGSITSIQGTNGVVANPNPITGVGTLSVNLSASPLGTLGIPGGGTGLASAIATGNFLMSNGSAYSAGSIAVGSNLVLTNVAQLFTVNLGTVAVTQGGTGLTAIVGAGNFLMNVGGVYAAGTIAASTGISVTNVAGTLTITNTSPAASTSIATTGTSYTASSANDYLLASGNITITLPSVSGFGKPLTIQKTDSSTSNVVTLSPQASDNFGTAGSTAISTTLNTFNESVILVPNGSTWYVRRTIPNSVVFSGTTAIGAVTTGGTKATGIVHDSMVVTREGRYERLEMQYQQSNTTGASPGTGDYLVLSPFTVDTTVVTPYNGTSVSVGTLQIASFDECWTQQGATWGQGFAILYDSTHFRIYDKTSNIFVSATQYPFTTTVTYHCNIKWPVSGWKGD